MKESIVIIEKSGLVKKNSSDIVTKQQVVSAFQRENYKPKMYVSVLRRFLDYLIDESDPINQISVNTFLNHLQENQNIKRVNSYKTPLNKLIKEVAPKAGFIGKFVIDSVIPNVEYEEGSIDEMFEYFLNDDKFGVKGERTKIEYRKAFREYLLFAEKSTVEIDVNELNKVGLFSHRIVSSYRNHLIDVPRKRKKGATTAKKLTAFGVNHLIAPLKSFAVYLLEHIEDFIKDDRIDYLRWVERDLRKIERIKGRKINNAEYHKDSLTHEEVLRVLDACKNPKEKFIVALMYYAGLRTAEVINLRIEDFNFKGNTLTVVDGKGLKTATIDIEFCKESLQEHFKNYLRFVKMNESDREKPLFQMKSTSSIRKFVNNLLIELELKHKKKPVTCHSFRHSIAQELRLRGVDTETIRIFLRHSDSKSTKVYIQKIETEHLQKIPANII